MKRVLLLAAMTAITAGAMAITPVPFEVRSRFGNGLSEAGNFELSSYQDNVLQQQDGMQWVNNFGHVHSYTASYDNTLNALTLTIDNNQGDVSSVTTTFAGGVNSWSDLEIILDGQSNRSAQIALNNIVLNVGGSPTNLTDMFSDGTATDSQLFSVTPGTDWSLTGDLSMSWVQAPSQERNRVRLVGVAAVPEPATMIALGSGLVALAARRRRK